eukprot:CAMPEP_0171707138 /NCGR_PEP_ID=MMETSP0991-20121206/14178_1 /TAXON_ID=483369 /ORGANISM="non described non described, Strain CCMP2098" /LENGTH=36 /DNA_ID= /DNA_START= /DNA_END= /DNA_ORIENTATION=
MEEDDDDDDEEGDDDAEEKVGMDEEAGSDNDTKPFV